MSETFVAMRSLTNIGVSILYLKPPENQEHSSGRPGLRTTKKYIGVKIPV